MANSKKTPIISREGIHFSRYLRHKVGIEAREIARADGVTIETVKKSIETIDTLRALHSLDFANEAAIQTIVDNQSKASVALSNGLTATVEKEVGKKKLVLPDTETQLKAFGHFTKLVEAIQPKGGKGVVVNANAQAAASTATSGPVRESQFVGFEDRIRNIRGRIQETNLLPSETGTTFDDENLEEDAEDEAPISV